MRAPALFVGCVVCCHKQLRTAFPFLEPSILRKGVLLEPAVILRSPAPKPQPNTPKHTNRREHTGRLMTARKGVVRILPHTTRSFMAAKVGPCFKYALTRRRSVRSKQRFVYLACLRSDIPGVASWSAHTAPHTYEQRMSGKCRSCAAGAVSCTQGHVS